MDEQNFPEFSKLFLDRIMAKINSNGKLLYEIDMKVIDFWRNNWDKISYYVKQLSKYDLYPLGEIGEICYVLRKLINEYADVEALLPKDISDILEWNKFGAVKICAEILDPYIVIERIYKREIAKGLEHYWKYQNKWLL